MLLMRALASTERAVLSTLSEIGDAGSATVAKNAGPGRPWHVLSHVNVKVSGHHQDREEAAGC